MSKTYRTDETPPSDMFVDSIDFGIGSAYMECGWCGREHFCPDSDYDPPDYGTDDDEAEWRKHCEQEFKENPKGVVLHYDTDSIVGKQLNGITFVVGCPCNGLSRFEKFIWNDRVTIRNYLLLRVNQEYQWAKEEKTLNKLAGFEDGGKSDFY